MPQLTLCWHSVHRRPVQHCPNLGQGKRGKRTQTLQLQLCNFERHYIISLERLVLTETLAPGVHRAVETVCRIITHWPFNYRVSMHLRAGEGPGYQKRCQHRCFEGNHRVRSGERMCGSLEVYTLRYFINLCIIDCVVTLFFEVDTCGCESVVPLGHTGQSIAPCLGRAPARGLFVQLGGGSNHSNG